MKRTSTLKRTKLSRGSSRLKRAARIRPLGKRGREDREAIEKVRAVVLKRARGKCERCHFETSYVGPLDLHHRRARSQGGKHDATNLVAICRRCHNLITDRIATDWREWIVTRKGAA